MTDEPTVPQSRAELNDELQSLLCRAHDNGVDLAGSYDCRNGAAYPDWDVVVTEVRKSDAAGD
jgi:hypothetical protein